jgi:hypothetical protein
MAEPFEVSIDVSEVMKAFELLPQEAEREILISAKEWLTSVQRVARMLHRYITHTSHLEKSVQVAIGKTLDEGGKVYLDTGIAHYGPYVHEGHHLDGPHGGWKPDQFLNKAAIQEESNLIPMLNKGLDRAVEKFNKGK